MSHYMTALAMKQRGVKPTAKIVLYWLADHYNEGSGACFPSLNTLADECEMDKSTVIRHLSTLEEAGLIKRSARTRENGSQTSTSYCLSLTPVAEHNSPCCKIQQPHVAKCDPHNLVNNNLVNEQEVLVAKATRQRKPEVDLPEGWIPNDKNVQDAMDRGFSAQEIENEADRFANFHRSKQNRFRDWDAAWRTWLGNARKFAATQRGKGGQGSSMVAAFAAVAARSAAEERRRAENTDDPDDTMLWGVDLS
jgi:DNA-binding MarR family transcriptional regulator